ncbi:hypothetical protein EC3003_2640 [Escherichia coli 3003]|nr:hypothetical protein EC3003_2640 [Escherichia coli 3003]
MEKPPNVYNVAIFFAACAPTPANISINKQVIKRNIFISKVLKRCG